MNKHVIIIRPGKYWNTFEATLMEHKKLLWRWWYWDDIDRVRGSWSSVSLSIQAWKIEHGLTSEDIIDETEDE